MEFKDLNLNLIQRIGIDKLQLSGFAIKEIDILKLIQMKKVDIQQSANKTRLYKRHMPDTNAGIAKIIIKDNHIFSDLIIGCANDSNGLPIEYVYLTVTVTNARGFNLENMSYIEYDAYIAYVLGYIESEYGIALASYFMKVDYLEINANVFLEQDFAKYNRVLKLLISLFHNHMGKLSTYDSIPNSKGLEEESYKRGNNSTEIVFYDKSKQLNDMDIPFDEDVSILRLELRLKNKTKIKSVFESCYWKDIDDKKIVEYFHKEICTQLSKKYEKWTATRNKELKKLIVSARQKSSKIWHHLIMQEVRNKSESMLLPYILDIEQICNAFRELPDPNRNVNRSIKSLLNISIENDLYKNNDIQKVYEIFNILESYSKAIS